MVTKNKKIVAIYIGRFQMAHVAHAASIKKANTKYDYTLVLIGSSNKRRSLKNPFEKEIVASWITHIGDDSTSVAYLNDYIYNETKWITQVQEIAYSKFDPATHEFVIVGYEKDASSYYLKEFPSWKLDQFEEMENGISATELRDMVFKDVAIQTKIAFLKNYMPQKVLKDVVEFMQSERYKNLLLEKKYFENEAKKFESYPYPDTLKLMCSDMLVVCDGHVLLIQRKVAPGKGAWALPGGFVNANETFKECAVRELYEETNLKVPRKIVENDIRASKIFDSPQRNFGIPRVSNTFFVEIKPDMKGEFSKLPKVKGADDALDAKWVPLAEAKFMALFDDHGDIIDYFVNSL